MLIAANRRSLPTPRAVAPPLQTLLICLDLRDSREIFQYFRDFRRMLEPMALRTVILSESGDESRDPIRERPQSLPMGSSSSGNTIRNA